MKYEEYINALTLKLERNFIIERDIVLFGNRIEMLAKYSNICGRTFITKNDIIDKYENHEHIYLKKLDNVTEEDIEFFGQFLKKITDDCIIPDRDHMSTYITGVLIGNTINEDAIKAVEKYIYRKAFNFYLKGWCDVRLVCVGLDDNEIATNNDGKKVKKVYELVY